MEKTIDPELIRKSDLCPMKRANRYAPSNLNNHKPATKNLETMKIPWTALKSEYILEPQCNIRFQKQTHADLQKHVCVRR